MKSRYLYLAASVAFLVGAVVEFLPPHNFTAAVLDAVAGAIFLFLGAGAQKCMKLDFDEDFLPVQQQHRYEADQHEGNGIEQRSERRIDHRERTNAGRCIAAG